MRHVRQYLLAVALVATGVSAQTPAPLPAEEQEDTNICVGGPHWRPTLADSAAIATEPVPASYRSLFESTAPCIRWALDEESLIDWHLRAGTERSIVPALAYLERDYLRGEPTPETYPAALQRAWRGAQLDLDRARAIKQPEGLNYSLQDRFTSASRTIRRLEALVETREKYIFLAEQHLRAAEEFGMLGLLHRAERYLGAAIVGGDFLAPLETQQPAQNLLFFNLHRWRTDDFEMRAAVLRARLSRSPADIASAEGVLQRKARPYYSRLAEVAFSGGDDFCDVSDGWSNIEEVQAACADDDEEDELQERVVNHLLARSMLDLVVAQPTGGDWPESYETALRLLNLERLPDRDRCCRRNTIDDIVRLRLAAAAERRHRIETASDPDDAIGFWRDLLADLREAERLTPSFEAPGRFRRIAEAWLETWRQGPVLFSRLDVDYSPPSTSSELRRYASYLRRTLASLDAIAAGGDAGLPTGGN